MSPTIRNQAKLAAIALAAGLVGTLFGAGAAVADNPHFITADINLNNDGDVVCSWKEAGLGTNEKIDYVCGAAAVGAFYQCVNKGGGEPRPHTVEDTNLEATGTFTSGKNGQITGSLLLEVPLPPSDFCPNSRNWTLKLQGVRWCDAFLTDTTNGITPVEVGELSKGDLSQVPTCDVLEQ
jgi:hypothetical protein